MKRGEEETSGLKRENFFTGGPASKESACNEGVPCSIPGPAEIPWIRKWQPTPAFFPRESHGQSSLVGHMGTHSPCGHKELDITEQLTHTHTHTHTHTRRTSGKGNMTKPTVCVVSGMKILGQTVRSLVTQGGRKASWNSRSEKILFFGPHFWGYLFFKKKKWRGSQQDRTVLTNTLSFSVKLQ